MKRKVWFCSINGNQTDHSSEWCSTLHPELLEKKAKFHQAKTNPNSLPRNKAEEPDTEANVTLSKKSEAKVTKFTLQSNFSFRLLCRFGEVNIRHWSRS